MDQQAPEQKLLPTSDPGHRGAAASQSSLYSYSWAPSGREAAAHGCSPGGWGEGWRGQHTTVLLTQVLPGPFLILI